MRAYRIAARYHLAELAKNTLAALLLAVLIPVWILAAPQIFAAASLAFRLRATGRTLTASTDHVGMIHGCLGVVMLLMAFLTFSAARQAGPFDRRLTAAGYPRTPLLLAKATSLLSAAALVALYTTVWTLAVWSPRHPGFLWLGLFTACLVYGSLGLVLALFLPGELEGMVVIFVTSNLDLLPQSPLVNPDPHGFLGPLLPMYGSTQTCLAAGLAPTTPLRPVAASLTWTAALTLVALLAFWIRTRERQGAGAWTHALSARAPRPRRTR
ncbi:hypothetical protein [Streptomyces diastatochromogenes]|uniref:ABC-2 type transporter domain-containing protein n=1 Tax=Streptomyces diastatochromogenes TaxID=42236 RepID=A0A233RWK3_STRDA|nr:hypothetical protein [Streptomyces diastatochromogenes]MCZ0990609.1 hypothetical protein [Streptomyces diastatochromogenes]OXY87749.1 hypothetical protein BEK98_43345 [Streptomyces diastatochromogenes]